MLKNIIHIVGQGGEYCSGMMPADSDTQCHLVFQNIQTILNAMQIDWVDIATMVILVVEHNRHKHKQMIKFMRYIVLKHHH
ncbi:Rid family hydrolase [Acinetobacter qingfengensis]|uniref:RidA family protein n=1 Tax=Acinetobacter qingfengensis TaxID=1262585 RepID=A0A1E7R1B0_9GAMM|nr:Rid family hydrolase [Acinetobacter qingfengensis]OEY93089.1 hypothetical protein BJI46_04940 [Acinetobacter qingfengensis]